MKKYIVSLVCLFIIQMAWTQERNEKGYFEVKFDDFELPQQDLIRSFEDATAMPFMANDVDGKEHFLGNYKGKVVFVYFWNDNCALCKDHIASLNLLQDTYAKELQIISFLDEKKAEATAIAKENGVTFPVLYNGKLLGEAAYGIELGYPRIFAIDKKGKIKQVIPSKSLEGQTDIYLQLENLFSLINNS